MIRVPDALQALVLALGTFRLVRLVGWDEITVELRRWVTGISDLDYNIVARHVENVKAGGGDPWSGLAISERRYYLAKLVRCPWCFGWWASLAVWLVWSWQPRVTIWSAVPFALSAAVGLIAKRLDP